MIEKRYTMDDERWYAYEIHEKYLHDQTTLKECGIREGIEIGAKKIPFCKISAVFWKTGFPWKLLKNP